MLKMEIKKVSDLINKKNYVPVLSDNKIIMVVNRENGKSYKPKNDLVIL
jgi:hypothetical protein